MHCTGFNISLNIEGDIEGYTLLHLKGLEIEGNFFRRVYPSVDASVFFLLFLIIFKMPADWKAGRPLLERLSEVYATWP